MTNGVNIDKSMCCAAFTLFRRTRLSSIFSGGAVPGQTPPGTEDVSGAARAGGGGRQGARRRRAFLGARTTFSKPCCSFCSYPA